MTITSSAPATAPVRGVPPPREARTRLRVRELSVSEHEAVADAWGLNLLQAPEWAAAREGWRAQRLGWFDGERLVGAAVVLYRPVPGTRRSLAYVPEGPALPWQHVAGDPARWLAPFVERLRAGGAFAVRIGPPVPLRAGSACGRHCPTASGVAGRHQPAVAARQRPVGA